MDAKRAVAVFAILFLSGLSLAADPTASLKGALSDLCSGITQLLPVASMLMVLVGAVTYASGQLMGAETRARANVWATAALTGAVTGMLISSVVPPVLEGIYGKTVSCTGVAAPVVCNGVTCGAGDICVSNHCCPPNTLAYCYNGCCPGSCSPGIPPVCLA